MIDKATARHHIQSLMFGYCEALDLGKLDVVADFFSHCTVTVEGRHERAVGSEEVRRFFDVVLFYKEGALASQDDPDSTPATRHLTSNVVIDVADDMCTATAKSCFTVFQSLPDFPLQAVISGRYSDSFDYVDEHWRFTRRHETVDLVGDLSRHLAMGLDELA